ncbi:aminotransferase class I/II-fold pyridoxal phosphate-dependent enzyme [Streptomyces niveus]|uniref:aminotransferase class I/II-fold pyridoxal phosphate-dependent enzyme n=1 Tax=Streptomyces niveus TaxID=193462 RepID=UPI00365E5D5C
MPPPVTLRNPYHDAFLRQKYGGDDFIPLSLGETGNGPPEGLLAALRQVTADSHGYTLDPYGLPVLHHTLRTYITEAHGLDSVATLGVDYEVAASEASTRNTMFQFGRLLLEGSHGTPTLVCSSPGWDYAGVFGALGFEIRTFPVLPEQEYQPAVSEFADVLGRARRDSADGPLLVALNVQHNPTGANWEAGAVREMVRSAIDAGASILVDDAYYAVHDAGITPTSALSILLSELRDTPPHRRPLWAGVRSMGKQFGCNGWGIGATTGPPDVVEALRTRLLPQYSYVSATPLQAAMAAWLKNPASDAYLAQQQEEYTEKRRLVGRLLSENLGYPAEAYSVGTCGAYMLMRTPPWYTRRGGGLDFREYVVSRTRVLLGEAFMTTPGMPLRDSHGYVRLFLGQPRALLAEALERLTTGGFTWAEPGL